MRASGKWFWDSSVPRGVRWSSRRATSPTSSSSRDCLRRPTRSRSRATRRSCSASKAIGISQALSKPGTKASPHSRMNLFAELRMASPARSDAGIKMKNDWKSAETETVMALLRDSLRDSIADHQLILDLLMQREVELPPDLGELLEDASNAYMGMSETVSTQFLTSRHRR